MEIEPDDPAEGEKAQGKYEALLALYPRDRAAEMMRAYYESLPPQDGVILEGMSAEELETSLEDMCDGAADASPEELAAIEQMKQGFRDMRGKKLSDLPEPTPEEDAEFYAEQADTAIVQILNGWINTLWRMKDPKHPVDPPLLTATLEPVTPILWGGKTWQEMVAPVTGLTTEQVAELHAAFAAKLRRLIDAEPNGYVLWSEEFVIRKETSPRTYYWLTSRP